MNKKLALAVILALPALAHAQSNVSLYGLYDAYLGNDRVTTNGTERTTTLINSGGLNTSFWGIKGIEQIGGLKAEFALEGFFRGDTGEAGRTATDGLFTKNAFVGVSGSFGRLTVGRQTALFYIVVGALTPFGTSTPFAPTVLQVYRPLGTIYPAAPLAGDTGWSNTVRYSTPDFKGLQGNVMFELPEGASNAPDHNRNRGIASTVTYKYGKLGAALGYQKLNLETNGDGHKQEAGNVSLAYDFGPVKAYVQWYRIWNTFNSGGSDFCHDIDLVGASVPLGGGKVLAGFGRTKTKFDVGSNANRRTWSLGYDYALSKRTDVYAIVRRDKADRDTNTVKDEILALGIRHVF